MSFDIPGYRKRISIGIEYADSSSATHYYFTTLFFSAGISLLRK